MASFSFKDTTRIILKRKLNSGMKKIILVNDYQRRYYSYNNDEEDESDEEEMNMK